LTRRDTPQIEELSPAMFGEIDEKTQAIARTSGYQIHITPNQTFLVYFN